jgi:hypothetical protein
MARRLPMQRPTLEDLDEVLKTFGDRVGLGGDRLHPRSILQLSTNLRERFLDVLISWETTMEMPTAWAHKVIAIPKPDGGGSRTIGLSSAALRVWSKLRQPLAAAWEDAAPDPAFWGAHGRPCDRAAWSHNIFRAAAQGAAVSYASVFLDLCKFYEMVGHDTFLAEASATGFSEHLAACLAMSWGGLRYMEVDGAASAVFRVHGTILAGCSAATSAAKVLVLRLIRAVRLDTPSLRLWNVVDDFAGVAVGPPAHVRTAVGLGTKRLIVGLRALGLDLSPGKSKVMASSAGLEQDIIKLIGQTEFKAASWARNVGADVSGRGGRRTSIAAARTALAASRSRRLGKLRRCGARTQRVLAASHNAAAIWGCSVNGVAPAALRRMRSSAARAFMSLSRGQCASRAMSAVGCDGLNPAGALNAAPIVEWATAVWTGFPARGILRLALEGARRTLAHGWGGLGMAQGHHARHCAPAHA